MEKTFSLSGLNRRSSGGVYATITMENEDWFHADFDENLFPIDRQYALFDFMKHPEQPFKGSTATVRFDEYSSGGVPVNPIIINISLS